MAKASCSINTTCGCHVGSHACTLTEQVHEKWLVEQHGRKHKDTAEVKILRKTTPPILKLVHLKTRFTAFCDMSSVGLRGGGGGGGGGTRTKKQQTGGEDGTVDPHRGRPIITVSLEKKRVEARREGRTKMKHGRRFLTFRRSLSLLLRLSSQIYCQQMICAASSTRKHQKREKCLQDGLLLIHEVKLWASVCRESILFRCLNEGRRQDTKVSGRIQTSGGSVGYR